MANTIITKNSSTASAVPAAGSLTQGELAVNVTDKKLYTKDSGGSVVEITPTNAVNATNATNLTGTTTASIPTSALASGTANASKILLGDRTWGDLPSSGVGFSTSGGTNQLGDIMIATRAVSSPATARYSSSYAEDTMGALYAGSELRYIAGTYSTPYFADSRASATLPDPQGTGGMSYPGTGTGGFTGTWRAMYPSRRTNYNSGATTYSNWYQGLFVRVL